MRTVSVHILTPPELVSLGEFNRRLIELEQALVALQDDQNECQQTPFLSVLGSRMDVEKEARIQFLLREDDPEYREDDDNILTERCVSLKHCHPFLADGQDHTAELIELARLGISPVCWLFHDLYDHDYGPDQIALPLREMLRIGSIWIDVVKTDQFLIELE